MSVKRQATTELNHTNWDQDEPEEQEEEGGGFKMAPKEVLEKRVMRTAKRRTLASNDETKKNVFSGFSGFNKPPKTSFDFLAKLTNGSKANKNENTSSNNDKIETSTSNNKPASSPSSNVFGMSGTSTPLAKSTFGMQNTESPAVFGNTAFSQSVFSPKTTSSGNMSPLKTQETPSSTVHDLTTKPSESSEKSATQGPAAVFGSSLGVSNSPKTLFSSSSGINTSPFKSQPVAISQPSVSTVAKTVTKPETKEDGKKLYYSKLKGLNLSVSEWIQKHVNESPVCILTPIFRDYEKHLSDIQDEYEEYKASVAKENLDKESKQNNLQETLSSQQSNNAGLFSVTKSNSVMSNTSTPEKISNFTFGINTSTVSSANTFSSTSTFSTSSSIPSTGFSFGVKPATTSSSPFAINTTTTSSPFAINTTTTSSPFAINTTTTSSPFAINTTTTISSPFAMNTTTTSSSPFAMNTTTTSSGNTPFSFGTGKPFSFNANIQKPLEPAKETEENEDEPPKVEYKPIVEENSVFDKKCKVFVKKDGNFIDKGVGTLYIKKIEESGKHQLLARANTALGNILLNFILSSSITTQRMGKSNVMLVCIPTPDAQPPPIPILIRVKTSEEADELLEVLNKYKA